MGDTHLHFQSRLQAEAQVAKESRKGREERTLTEGGKLGKPNLADKQWRLPRPSLSRLEREVRSIVVFKDARGPLGDSDE